MLFELFVLGSFWFWLLVVAEIALLFMFLEYENGFGATASVLVFGALLQLCGDVNITGYIASHPYQVAMYVLGYFVVGALWGTAKWWLYVKDRLEEYEEVKTDWLRGKGETNTRVIPEALKGEWKTYLQNSYQYRSLATAPVVKDNKARVLRWMTFWWVSMVWSLINDFVKRIFKAIYHRMVDTLQAISDRIYAGVRSDLE